MLFYNKNKGNSVKVITFLNSKGGVGKSTLSFNLARHLQLFTNRHPVMLVDADLQGSLSSWHDISELGFKMIVANTRQSIVSARRLAKESNHKIMIIDTAGKILDVSGAAISQSDLIIIPIQASAVDVWATLTSVDLIRAAQSANPHIKAMFVINQITVNSTLNNDVASAISEQCPDIPLCKTMIAGRLSFARSANDGNTIYETNDLQGKVEINNFSLEALELLND